MDYSKNIPRKQKRLSDIYSEKYGPLELNNDLELVMDGTKILGHGGVRQCLNMKRNFHIQ